MGGVLNMILKIILLVILILINGVFSATEIAFLSINKYDLNKMVKKGDSKAIRIAKLIDDSSSFLSAIQIAITLSGFLASAFAAENFASEIADMINITVISKESLTNILIIIITIILSYFTLVFGELVPKKIGLAYSNKIAYAMVGVIYFVMGICRPFIWVLKTSTDFVVKLFHIKNKDTNDEEEIKDTIVDSSLEELEKKLLLNVFEFNDIIVEEVMTSKDDVISIDINCSKEDIINIIKDYKYTRFPIVRDNEIIGLLNIKDLIINNNGKFNLEKYMRKIIVLDSNTYIDDAFLYLNSHYEAFAMVKKWDEYIGIVTIEDILESVIGNIFDEYDNK